MDEIVKVFDDAMLVAVVRHPGASIASLVERFGFGVELATTTWLRMNQVLAHDGAAMGDRLMLTRYEDLAREPEPVLRELLEWLEEPWSPAVHQDHEAPASKWTTALTEDDRRSVREETESWARFFGYEVDEPLHGVTRTGVIPEALPADRRRARGAPPRVRQPARSAPPPEAAPRGSLQAAAAKVRDPREGARDPGLRAGASATPVRPPPAGSGAACAHHVAPGGRSAVGLLAARRQSREPDQAPRHRILEERRVEQRMDEDRGQPERRHERGEADGLAGRPGAPKATVAAATTNQPNRRSPTTPVSTSTVTGVVWEAGVRSLPGASKRSSYAEVKLPTPTPMTGWSAAIRSPSSRDRTAPASPG